MHMSAEMLYTKVYAYAVALLVSGFSTIVRHTKYVIKIGAIYKKILH